MSNAPSSTPPRVLILGAGRLAGALMRSLHRAAVPVRIWSRRPEQAEELRARLGIVGDVRRDLEDSIADAEIVLFCVSDRAIRELSERVAIEVGKRRRAVALHTSGSLDPDELDALAECGWQTGSLHPLVALPTRGSEESSSPFESAFFSIAGTELACTSARGVVEALGAQSLKLREGASRSAYHAAAALLSNGLVALFDLAWEQLAREAEEPEAARAALLVLLASTAENLAGDLPAQALTGPVSRGDVPTVASHLAALGSDAGASYRALGRRALRLASQSGALSESQRLALAQLFD